MPTDKLTTNLKDVALVAGVSAATVSRVLNKRSKGFSVRPEVRDRVESAARKLSYRPHLLAQSLRMKSMGIVGLLGIEVPMILPDDVIRGLVSVLEPSGIKLSTYFAPSVEMSHALPPWRIDGAIVTGVLSKTDFLPLERAGLPYVCINDWTGKLGGSVVYDEADGVNQALTHLVQLGHRRIAYANARGPWLTHPSVKLRHEAYCAYLRQAGLTPVPGHDQPWTEEDAHANLRHWVEDHGVTAVLTYQHYYALEVIKAAHESGYSPPSRLSVVCFNDEYIGRMAFPSLTAVKLPGVEAGRLAAKMLLDGMKPPYTMPKPIVLKPTLVINRSTSTPDATRARDRP